MKLSCHVDLRDFLSLKQKMPRALYLLIFFGLQTDSCEIKGGSWKLKGKRVVTSRRQNMTMCPFLGHFVVYFLIIDAISGGSRIFQWGRQA